MKKIQIKGKDYIEVNERIKEFHKQYENGSISTDLIEMTDRFITKTTVIPDAKNPDRKFTGIAYEKEDSTFINKTSALENCETSSVGRALGMLGIGIDTSVASYDEVANAIEQQESKPKTANTTPISPPAPPKINLKDQEVPNPEFEKALDNLDGMPVGDKAAWDGSEVVGFKNGKNVGKAYNQLDFPALEWILNECKVDAWKEKAKLEMNRRGA